MFTWIGMPDNGVLAAATLPLLLTASLFLGPLVQAWYEWTLAGVSLIPPQANLLLLRNLLFVRGVGVGAPLPVVGAVTPSSRAS